MSAAEPSVPPATTLLGRDAALRDLAVVLDSAEAGKGRLALISGEAGAGLTTLALETVKRATARGFTAHWAACSVQSAGWPYWPWCQLIQSCLSNTLASALPRYVEAIAPALPAVAPTLADEFHVRGSDRAAEGFALFQTVARFWAMVAVDQGRLLLAIDDLQWADPGSVHLLAHVATMLRQSPMALLATVRVGVRVDEEMTRGFAELDRCTPIVVSAASLSASALAELARRHGLNADAAVVDLLAQRSGGNPLFATEIVRVVGSRGGVVPVESLVDVLPARLVRAVQLRVAALDPAVARLLEAASVVGIFGKVAVLSAVVELDLDSTVDLLSLAGGTGLIAPGPAMGWRFVHGVVRDAIYRSLPTATRRRLHERAMEALQAAAAPPSQLAWQARYAAERGEVDRAIALLVEAGKEHLSRQAFGSAVDSLARAITLAEAEADADTPAHAARLLLLAEAYRRFGDTARAKASYHAAARAAVGDPDLLGAATLGFTDPAAGQSLTLPRAEGGNITLLRRALAALGDSESATRVRLLARIATEYGDLGDHKRAGSIVADALAMALRVSDASACVEAMAAHHRLRVIGQTPLGAALAESAEMIQQALTAGDPWTSCLAHRARFLDLMMTGDMTAADTELANLVEVTAELGDTAGAQWWIMHWRAMRALLGGYHTDAAAFTTKARELGNLAGVAEAETSWLAQVVFLYRERDRLGELEADVRAFLAGSPYDAATDTLAAVRAAEIGDLDEAADALTRIVNQVDVVCEDRDWAGIWFQLARVAYLVDDRTAAAILYEHGGGLSGQCVLIGPGAVCCGAADLALAWLADTLGNDTDARRWYASAEVLNTHVAAVGWLAQTRLDHAGLLARRARSDDLSEADRLAHLAASASVRVGLRNVLGEADDLLAGLNRTSARTTSDQPRSDQPPSDQPTSDPAESDPAASEHGTDPPATRLDGHESVFRRLGQIWELGFGGVTVRLPHAKGLADIAHLLARPGQPTHVSELMSRQAPGIATQSGADEVFDARARREIRQRLADLETEVDEAAAGLDLARAERARAERAHIMASLSSGLGLRGRARRLNDPTERARKAVTARIRSSIDRIAAQCPALGRHLERSIDTGLWCVYRPEQPTVWRS